MAEKIGLQAVLETKSFQQGLNSYLGGIAKMQGATASVAASVSSSMGGVSNSFLKVSQVAGSSIGSIGGFASALGDVAKIAAGNLLASGIEGLVGGIKSFISVGASAVGEAQKLEAGLGALLTQNNLYERTTKEVTVAVAGFAEEQAKAAGKAEDLAFKQEELRAKIDLQKASIQEQKQRIIQLTAQYGEQGLATIEAAKKLTVMETQAAGMERQLGKLGQTQADLTNITQKYTTATVTSYEQINDFTTAQRLAAEQTQELLRFVDKLSIVSPFESEQVALVTKYAVGAGLAVDETKAFTTGFLDLAAAVGIGSDGLAFASDQLLQVAKIGKITTIDLRQLRRLGIDLEKIIGVQMGLSIDEFNAKAEKSPEIFQELFNGVAEFSAKTFPGAAQKLASSLGGLGSTISDIFKVSAKNLLRPMVDAAGPAVSEILGRISDVATGSELAGIGQRLGEALGQGIARAQEIIAKVTGAFGRFGARGAGVSILGLIGLDPTQIAGVMGVVDQVVAGIEKIQGAYERFGLRGATTSLLGQLGLEPETINTLRNAVDSVIEVISRISFEEIKGALTGIGAVLAGGAIAALIVGVGTALASLITPIGVLAVAAGTLGAAWAGNWFGIRDTVTQTWATIQPVLTNLWTWLSTNIPAAIQTVSDIWTNTLRPGFMEIYNAVSAQVIPALQNLFDTFTGGTGGTQTLSDLWNTTLLPAIKAVGDFLINTLFPAWVDLEVFLAGALATAIQTVADYWQNWLFPAMGKVQEAAGAMAKLWTGTLEPAILTVGDYLNATLVPLLVSIGELFNAVINKALEASAAIWQNVLFPALQKVGQFLKDTIMPTFSSIGKTVKGDVSPVLKDLGEVVIPLLSEAIEFVNEAIQRTISYFEGLKNAVNNLSIPDWIQMHSPPPLATALNMVASGADSAAAALSGMQKSLLTSTPNSLRFIDDLNLGGFLDEAGAGRGGVRRNFRNIIKNTIMANMQGLADGTVDIMDQIMQTAARFNFPPQMAAEFAKAEGLIGNLTGKFAEFQQQIRIENLGNLVQMAGAFAGIGSSFSSMLEQQIASGPEAIKTVEAYRASLDKLIATEGNNQIAVDKKLLAIEKANEALGFGERQMAIYQQELEALMVDEEGNALQIEKKILQMDRLTESMDAQGKTLITLKEELVKLTGEMDKNQKAVEAAKKGYEALQAQAFNLFSGSQSDAERIQSELATIALLEDFLRSEDSSFLIPADAVSQAAGITGILYDRISGQAELNRLLAEQERREELITKQKEAQQKLNFLQQQVELIKMGRELGGNIFQGITFGLNASVEDLLAATNAIVEAMVNQINSDLQIGSPSRLMINTFKQVMAGAAIGMERGQSLLSDAVRSIPVLNGTIPQPVFSQPAGMGAGGGTVYNYNFPMTVNTAASPQAVVRQYEIKRSMYAN